MNWTATVFRSFGKPPTAPKLFQRSAAEKWGTAANLWRFAAVALLIAAGTVVAPFAPQAYANGPPWQLRGSDTPPAAPAGINSAHVRPGPHRVVVAVIDSGLLIEHPNLVGQFLPGYDMQQPPLNLRGGRSPNVLPDERDGRCQQRISTNDYRTHGTEIASVIAGNGWQDMWGVNASARILPIRIVGACGMARQDLVDAVSWAGGLTVAGVPDNPHPAQIINLSLAGGQTTCGPDLQAKIDKLMARNIFIVAAAGNNFRKALPEPANCRGVISVGALDAENKIEFYSALDPRTSIYAPGGGRRLPGRESWHVNKLQVATYEIDVLGREQPSVQARGMGTSYAAPLVSGFISLWLSYRPKGTRQEWLDELPQFLRPLTPPDDCEKCTPLGLSVNEKVIRP